MGRFHKKNITYSHFFKIHYLQLLTQRKMVKSFRTSMYHEEARRTAEPYDNTSSSHIKTYTAGEDNGRLAALARELGLQKQRQVRKPVRSTTTSPPSMESSNSSNIFSGSFFNSPTRDDSSYRENKKNASHIQICTNFAGLPLTSEEAQAKLDRCPTFRKATDKFSLMSNNSQ